MLRVGLRETFGAPNPGWMRLGHAFGESAFLRVSTTVNKPLSLFRFNRRLLRKSGRWVFEGLFIREPRQYDDGVELDEDGYVTHIAKEPLEEERIYKAGTAAGFDGVATVTPKLAESNR